MVNVELKGERGVFSKFEKTNITKIDPILIPLPKSQKIDIFIPVSNYSHRMGGVMLEAPEIGKYEFLDKKIKKEIITEIVSTMIVCLMAIFAMLYFFIFNQKKNTILFINVLNGHVTTSINRNWVYFIFIHFKERPAEAPLVLISINWYIKKIPSLLRSGFFLIIII